MQSAPLGKSVIIYYSGNPSLREIPETEFVSYKFSLRHEQDTPDVMISYHYCLINSTQLNRVKWIGERRKRDILLQ